jgi:hypothetical protein
MKNVSKTLAAMAECFSTALNEATTQTETGKQLVNKYQSYVIANDISCSLVNGFIQEARTRLYDKGVNDIVEKLSFVINANKYSWLLESACERLENNPSAYNYLAKNACKQVRPLLEMAEADLVTYVKAGALKNVMFVESFRNIKNAILRDQPVVEHTNTFDSIHPISMVEKKDDTVLFEVKGNIYSVTSEGIISEANTNDVSMEFKQISRLLESNEIKYANETLTYELPNMVVSINEAGKLNKTTKDGKVYTYTTEQMREFNQIYLASVMPNRRNHIAENLETLCKIAENFDNIVMLDNVQIFNTARGQFMIIENKEGDKCFAHSINAGANTWYMFESITNIVKTIKENYNVDLTEKYQEKITSNISEAEKQEAEKIQESLETNAIDERKQKVAMLTEKFKNDPTKLAILSKIAHDLNSL